MPKSDPVADAMARLKTLRADPKSPEALSQIEKALASKANILVARAADVIHDAHLSQFIDPLIKAFDRFMVNPTTTDKGCPAKTSIAKALYELEARAENLFLTGIHHSQPEGVWGGSSDTATELRGICALGLVRCNYRDAMIELGDLLMDPEPPCRMMAARAIAYSENDAGVPLLRMKVLSGDQNFDVVGECFSALLKLSPRKNVEFVSRYIHDRNEDIRESAILSLGESRLPDALTALTDAFQSAISGEERKPLILAIALTRLPQSIDFLVKMIGEEHWHMGLAAIDAMKIYRADANVKTRLTDAVKKKDQPDLSRAFEKAFAVDSE